MGSDHSMIVPRTVTVLRTITVLSTLTHTVLKDSVSHFTINCSGVPSMVPRDTRILWSIPSR